MKSMNLPLDPTRNGASPQELIQSLPSQAARQRVFQAAGISIDVDDRNFEATLDELSDIELRQAASQLRFAGVRTVYYYRVEELRQVSPDEGTGRTDNADSPGAYGPEVRTALRDHDRIYVVCDVPETGTQAQLSFSEENRETTVATFKPRSELLAVRAPDEETADATSRAVVSYLDLTDWSRVSFLDGGIRGRFEDACVDGYSNLRLKNTNPHDHSKEIEVRSKESEAGEITDVREDAVVETLLRQKELELNAATGLISMTTGIYSSDVETSFDPRVTIGFPEGRVTFEQFVPEEILIKFDDIVRQFL
jgi:hypothetical protein